jgi:hypothetical protein
VTEVFPAADWDATAYQWGGASTIGLPDGDTPTAVSPADDYRRAIAQANAGPETAPLRAQPRGPDMFPALPPAPPPGPPAAPTRPAPARQHDTGPQRLPRYSRTTARPRPRRAPDCAIFIWSDLLSQHIMKCGICLRSRYADPIAGTMPFTFESLRVSAHVSGWRLDAFTRWACPACQGTPAYRSPYPVTHSHPELRALRKAGQPVDEPVARAVLGSDPRGELAAVTVAEHDLICDVAAAASEHDLIADVAAGVSRGKHAAGAR